jgi:hypothetical protein
MACIMLAGCIAELRVLDDLGVARGIPPTVEEQHTARFARSDSLAAVEAVARRHGMRKKTKKIPEKIRRSKLLKNHII